MIKTNLEKWNNYLSIIEEKTNEFIDSQIKSNSIPSVYYVVNAVGNVVERTIIGYKYSHHKHGGITYFTGKKPTRKEVEQLAEYSSKQIPFSVDNLWVEYSEIFNKESNLTSKSSVKFLDVVQERGLYYSINDAKIQAKIKAKFIEEEKRFKELHKKGADYDYHKNGYKFLGWQNGWKHDYYDEDGKLCRDTGKPKVSFGYSKEKYPKYRNCIDSKHRRIEVSHNRTGSENTVSCPICKVYWKYDCSG